MTRDSDITDRSPSPPAAQIDRNRTPSEIEDEIGRIRSHMDGVIDEIEFRLSPGQMASGAFDMVRDMVRGNPGRLGRAIRDNPIPVVLIGIGVTWLAVAVSRTGREQPRLEERREDRLRGPMEGPVGEMPSGGITAPPPAPAPAPTASPSPTTIRVAGAATSPSSPTPVPSSATPLPRERVAGLLADLVAHTRQGADGFRQAESIVLGTPALKGRLREMAEQFDRTASALQSEVERHGGPPQPSAPPHPAWEELRRALAARQRTEIIAGLDRGTDATLDAFRRTLHENLPPELRVLVGAHFHDIETLHNRVVAIEEAAG